MHFSNLYSLINRPLLEYVTDKSPEVRQAAAYGVGLMAQFAGEAYADAIKGIIVFVFIFSLSILYSPFIYK